MRAYLKLFCGVSASVVGAVGALNYVVDPYLTHQWDTPPIQLLRPVRERLGPWAKTYALARYRPDVVYVGNSRTEVGLPALPALFGGRTVFNAGLSGATLGDAAMMAQHAARVSRLHTLVWGLDAPSFSLDVGNTEMDAALLADGGGYLARRAMLNMKRAVSLEMARDSLRLLSGAQEGVCRSSLAFLGQRDTACLVHRFAQKGGTAAAVQPRLGEFVHGVGPTADALNVLRARLAELCGKGARVRLYVNPTHALMLDTLYWAGKWGAMETWLRALAAAADQRRAGGCDVTLVDFSGFNSVTTEPVPQASGRQDMAYYWEPSHYRDNVGRMILSRILGDGGMAPADFGVELTTARLPAHLAAMRAARDKYHMTHAAETAFARKAAQQLEP
ncbi:hypothetical protein LJR289_001661 [Pseudoduganella sp. LjRoot289]|uniref:hypothetical protein n=1 Tax=Pseudoduganella sp. LjRoot289 TaxID=3342314 RepID=UPI003ECFC21A